MRVKSALGETINSLSLLMQIDQNISVAIELNTDPENSRQIPIPANAFESNLNFEAQKAITVLKNQLMFTGRLKVLRHDDPANALTTTTTLTQSLRPHANAKHTNQYNNVQRTSKLVL